MHEGTFVFRSSRLAEPLSGWKLYRLRTENSVYELELQAAANASGRRCAVLTCVEPAARAGEVFEDSSPMLGTRSLFEVSPMEWIGGRLSVGTAETSLVQEVAFVSSRAEPSTLARLNTPRPQPAVRVAEPPPPPPPRKNLWDDFPTGHVQMAEAAASVLKSLCHREDLFFAVRADSVLERRLQLALAECRLMLEAMARR